MSESGYSTHGVRVSMKKGMQKKDMKEILPRWMVDDSVRDDQGAV
jgi:hypothetical protein